MTRKEVEAVKEKELWITDRSNWNKKQQRIDAELSCIEMIDSIICYGSCDYDYVINNRYLESYIDELGLDKVKELVKGQIDEKPYIKRDVYTDNEGLTYNSLIFKDEEGYNE